MLFCVAEDSVVDRPHRGGRDDECVPGEICGLVAFAALAHRKLLEFGFAPPFGFWHRTRDALFGSLSGRELALRFRIGRGQAGAD